MGSPGTAGGSLRPTFAPGGAQGSRRPWAGVPAQEQGRWPLSFTGEYRHTIDSKGRLIVPSRLRDELSGDRVVLVKYLNGCIAMWSQEGWERLEHDLLELGRSNATARGLVRNLAASAHQDEVDRQGRISVPQNLRDYSGITRDVVVTGALDHGEVWNPDRWREQQVGTADLDELAQQLKF